MSTLNASRPFPDSLVPPISDDSGYLIRRRDLHFLLLSDVGVENWRRRASLLGMKPSDYQQFTDGLWRAIAQDRYESVDVRVKGSSAGFFSGAHKTLPAERGAWAEIFQQEWLRSATHLELDRIELTWSNWIHDGDKPIRRPFDALYRLSLARYGSDYDIQLCSDEMFDRARVVYQEAEHGFFTHAKYEFLNKDLVELVCPMVSLWAKRQGDQLGREVTLAVFSSAGPRNRSAESGALSSHFRDEDWRIVHEAGIT